MTNLMLHITHKDNFTTYIHGNECIDYILCDTQISDDAVVGCYKSFQFQTRGDHRNMIIVN